MDGEKALSSSCLEDERVLDYVQGHLEGNAVERVEQHLPGCSHCRRLVSEAAKYFFQTTALSASRLTDKVPTIPKAGAKPQRLSPSSPLELGRYQVRQLIGAGAMGVVYSAYDSELDREVAVKVVRGGTERQNLATRLRSEAQAMAQLLHPNVVTIFDIGTVGDQVFIAMEFVDGETVSDWVKKELPSTREVVGVFLDAARGLAAAHERGLVHRDVKPQNILLGKDGRARVTDFGLSRFERTEKHPRLSDSDGREWTWCGTPGYMAPEQLSGAPADARTDQFGFAVALYEALYGERPFGGDTLEEIAQAVKSGSVRVPPRGRKVPAALRATLLRALSVLPEDRFPNMAALIEALQASTATPLGESKRPLRTWVAVAFTLIVAGGAMVAYRAMESRRQAPAAIMAAPPAVARAVDPAPQPATAPPAAPTAAVSPPTETSPPSVAEVPAPKRRAKHRPAEVKAKAPAPAPPASQPPATPPPPKRFGNNLKNPFGSPTK